METANVVVLSELEEGTVILFDNEKGENFKLVLSENQEPPYIGNCLFSKFSGPTDELPDGIESDPVRVAVARLQIGKEVSVLTAPVLDGKPADMQTLELGTISNIEIYS